MTSAAAAPLAEAEVRALYGACPAGEAGSHDAALLAVLLNCGLTLAEAAGLRWPQVDFDRSWLQVIGPERRPRFVPLNRWARELLAAWQLLAPRWPFVFGCWNGQPAGWRARFSGRRRESMLQERLAALGRTAGVSLDARRTAQTLVHRLLDHSEEGRLIRSLVPADRQAQIQLPVANMSPFSTADRHTGMVVVARGMVPSPFDFLRPPEEDDIIRRGRRLLDAVGRVL